MFATLFRPRKVEVYDGDGSCATNAAPHGADLRQFIQDGLSLWPVQILHYATVHYVTRHKTLAGRYLNAWTDAGHFFAAGSPYLTLDDGQHPELKRQTSEIIGVGLATLTMCRALGAKPQEVLRIEGAGKRCDYQILSGNELVVYEARGRQHHGSLSAAVGDLAAKKAAHTAHYKYGLVSVIPRDGTPVSVHIFDPPGDQHVPPPNRVERLFRVATYYERASRLAGLWLLADAIEERLAHYRLHHEWLEGRLEVPDQVLKLGYQFRVGDNSFWTGHEPTFLIQGRYPVRYAIDQRIRDSIWEWNLESLLEFRGLSGAIPEGRVSISPDGSLLEVSESPNDESASQRNELRHAQILPFPPR